MFYTKFPDESLLLERLDDYLQNTRGHVPRPFFRDHPGAAAMDLVSRYHPYWRALTTVARVDHARAYLSATDVDFVVCDAKWRWEAGINALPERVRVYNLADDATRRAVERRLSNAQMF